MDYKECVAFQKVSVRSVHSSGRWARSSVAPFGVAYWETGASRYSAMARRHALQSARYLILPDHTSYHTYSRQIR